MAKIKENDKVVIIDESTTKTKFHTAKTIYPEGEDNLMKKSANTYRKNFLAVLGLNVESTLFVVKNLDEYNIEEHFKYDRMVLMLDNAPSHTSTFVLEIAEKLNIYFTPMPKYAPWLNCVEKVWDIIKYKIKLSIIRKPSELVNMAFKTFNEKCKGESLIFSFKEKYIPFLC